jgi:carboxypeptidase family protein
MLATLSFACAIAFVAPQSAPRGVAVAGVVQDQTGAVLPGAQVELTPAGTAVASQTMVTTPTGSFRFDRVPPGSYDIRITFAGFRPNITRLRVGARPPAALTIVMAIEGVTQEVSVTTGAGTSPTASANLNAISVDASALDDLPVLDQDVVGTLSRFLDSSAIGTNGASIVVDGLEVNGLTLSASAIQQIKINQDPYAAEFMRPGRGRIEIITKPGGREYTGALNLRFRDSDLAARNAFAATKPQEQRRIVEGTLGGPVPDTARTSFLLSASYDDEAIQSIVFAQTPAGLVNANVSTPFSNLIAGGSWSHQQSDTQTTTLRFSHLFQRNTNQGVGGATLPEAGFDHTSREDEVVATQQSVVSPHLLNEVRFLYGDEREPRTSVTSATKIVVLDAFVGGGAQVDSVRTEHHFTLVEAMTLTAGRHTVKYGINIPDWSWRGFDDRTNLAGTFAFSSLADYAAGRPYSFVQQSGDGRVHFLEKVVGLFAQDELRLRPNLSLDFGLRYDWQGFFHDDDNMAPRFSFAYSPDAHGETVIRGGAGVFYDRTGPGPILDLLRYDGEHLKRYVLVDPGFPTPLQPGQALGAQPSSIVQLAPVVGIPLTVHYSVGVERQLRPKTTLAVNLIGSRGHDLFRSRDVNAPLPPLFAGRPDPTLGVVRQIESAGTQRTVALQLTLRGQVTKFFSGSTEYTLTRAYNDTGGIGWMPPNSYDLSLEYARADFTQRHRFDLIGSLTPGKRINIGIAASLYSGRPYSLTTGLDSFNTGTANARPSGVPRNSLTGPGFGTIDLRWSREFVLAGNDAHKRTITPGIDLFNATNRVNYSYYVGNLSSPFFGRAISAQAPRRVQLSLRMRY